MEEWGKWRGRRRGEERRGSKERREEIFTYLKFRHYRCFI
jgi:hypothetical protein